MGLDDYLAELTRRLSGVLGEELLGVYAGGADMSFRVDEEPGEIEGFWFAIDRAILRDHGVALAGPPPAERFAPIPRAALLPLLRESVDWHRESEVPLGTDVGPQHLPRPALRHRGDVVAQAQGGRLGRGSPRRSPATRSTAPR